MDGQIVVAEFSGYCLSLLSGYGENRRFSGSQGSGGLSIWCCFLCHRCVINIPLPIMASQ